MKENKTMMSAVLILLQNQVLVNLGRKLNTSVHACHQESELSRCHKEWYQWASTNNCSPINIDVTVDLKSYFAYMLYSRKCVVKLLSIHTKINFSCSKDVASAITIALGV